MKYDKVVVKQIPDDYATYTGLNKYGKSKMPQTYDRLQACEGPDGRTITGLDEDAWAIAMIQDDEKREKVKNEKKNLRLALEKATGKKLDAQSDFWDTFFVTIGADSDLTLNRSNPLDIVKYHVLVSNGYAAPDLESAGLPEFRNAKYYCYVDERVNREEVSTQKLRDRARAKLLQISETHDLTVLIGQALEGDKYKMGMDDNTLYKMLSDYINNVKEPDNVKRFIRAVDTSVEDLQFKVTVDRAVKKKVIRYRDGYYQRGQVTLGRSITEIYDNLKLPEFATEFLSIKEEVG